MTELLLKSGARITNKTLGVAISSENLELIQMLLNKGADVNSHCGCSRDCTAPLTEAIRLQNPEMTELLLESGAKITNETLTVAVSSANHELIRMLLNEGADVNSYCVSSGEYTAPLTEAIRLQNPEMTELLLESGAKITNETLTVAVSSANHELIRMLLNEGADVNSYCVSSGECTTPLAEAIRLQNPETIELLQVSNRVRLDDDIQFSAAIIAASEVGDIAFVERLIQLGGQARAEQMGEALAITIRKGQDKAVAVLFEAGADLNISPQGYGYKYDTPLVEAIRKHNAALMHLLLEEGAFPDDEGAMQKAVECGNVSIVKALIRAGALVDITENDGVDPLIKAVKSRDQALIQLLLDAGADLDRKRHRDTALQVALRNEDISITRYLLDWGADPADTEELGITMAKRPDFLEFVLKKHRMRHTKFPVKFGCHALTWAVRLRDEHAIITMLERGLDAGSLIKDGQHLCSPFGHAIYNSTVNVMKLFLQKGYDPNCIVFEISRMLNWDTYYRLTGFLAAIETRNVSKVKLLHRYGADVNLPTHTTVRRTPLQEAAAAGSTDIVEFLMTVGAEVNAPAARSDGGTALQFAAIGGHIPLACLLLNARADVNAPASKVNGRTALEGAAEHGRLDMLQVLLNAGAGDSGKDQGEFERAIALARKEDHDHIADFLEDYLRRNRQEIGIEPMDGQTEEEVAAQPGCLDELQLSSNAEAGDQEFDFSTDFLDDILPQTQGEDEHWMPTGRTGDDFRMYDYNGEDEFMDVDEIDRILQDDSFPF